MDAFRRRLLMATAGEMVGEFTLDQSGTYTSPAQMIQNRKDAVFKEIFKRSHLYIGYLDNGVLQCKQVSDSNKTIYADGTAVSYGGNDDLFMKLPQFWWKCETQDVDGDIVKFTFVLDDPQDASWYEWAGNTFIGVYKGYKDGSNRLRSISGVTPTTSTTFANWRTYSRNHGTGYQMITYEAHQMMALLFYGLYGTLDSQGAIGYGSSGIKTTGACNSRGMSAGQNSGCVNFWGLENWWTDAMELVDNLRTTDTNGTVAICDVNNNVVRYSSGAATQSLIARKMRLGANADLIAKVADIATNVSQCYADQATVQNSNAKRATRGGYSGIIAGINSLIIWENSDSGYIGGTTGTRLQYKGAYNIL